MKDAFTPQAKPAAPATQAAPWSPDQKKQYLNAHGYNDSGAQAMMYHVNPASIQGHNFQPQEAPKPVFTPALNVAQNLGSKKTELSPANLESLRANGLKDDVIADQFAQSSPFFANKLQNIRTHYNNDPEATSAFLNARFYGTTSIPKQDQPQTGPVGRAMQAMMSHAQNMQQFWDQSASREINPAQAFMRTGLEGFHAAAAPVAQVGNAIVGAGLDVVGGIDNMVTGGAVTRGIQQGVQDVVNSDIGQAVGSKFNQLKDATNASPENSGLRDLAYLGRGAADIASVMGTEQLYNSLGGAALDKAAFHPIQTTKTVAKNTAGTILHPWESVNNLRGSLPAMGAKGAIAKDVSKGALARTGMDERLSNLMTDASPADKSAMGKMVEMHDAAAKDFTSANPKEIVGGTALLRYNHINDIKKGTGELIGGLVKAAGDEPIKMTDTYNNYLGWLRDNNVMVNEKGVLSLEGSRVPKEDLPFLQALHNKIAPGGEVQTFGQAHQTRQWMFKAQDIAQQRQLGYTDLAKQAAEDVHSNMLTEMGQAHPAYEAYAKPYAEMSRAQQAFAKLMGKSSPEELTARDLRAGEIAKRMTGNASADSLDVFSKLEETARKYGFNASTDVRRQAYFADAIGKYYPNFSPGGLTGQVEKAGEALGMAKDVATGNVLSMAVKVGKKIIGQSEERQLAVIKKFLSANAGEMASMTSPDEVEAVLQSLFGEHYVPKTSDIRTPLSTLPATMEGPATAGQKALPLQETQSQAGISPETYASTLPDQSLNVNAPIESPKGLPRNGANTGKSSLTQLKGLIKSFDAVDSGIVEFDKGASLASNFKKNARLIGDIDSMDLPSASKALRAAIEKNPSNPSLLQLEKDLYSANNSINSSENGLSMIESGFREVLNGVDAEGTSVLMAIDDLATKGAFKYTDVVDNNGTTLQSLIDDYTRILDGKAEKAAATRAANKSRTSSVGEFSKTENSGGQSAITKTSDPAEISRLKDSINEGKTILNSGTFNGKKLTPEELSAVSRSVENAQARIGEQTIITPGQTAKDGYKMQEISSAETFNMAKNGVSPNDLTKDGLKNWKKLQQDGKAKFVDGKFYHTQ